MIGLPGHGRRGGPEAGWLIYDNADYEHVYISLSLYIYIYLLLVVLLLYYYR